MLKQVFIIGLIVILASTQTTVTPKTQACACTNLLSQADCNAKSGCTWTFATTTNSTTNTTTTSTTQGTCANSTTPVVVVAPPTYCLNVTNVTLCAQTIGCAFLNNTCTIFTGCSAYVQTTNAACQAISTQCTTDGTRCVVPTACSTYTTQALCTGNLATSGAKSCTWTASGSSGTCADKVCADAPATYTTQAQCTGWIAGCLTTGKGCATTLGACSSYTQANGCTGMIGSDGPCTANTAAGSTVCRPLVCTDAATTLATNSACASFLSGCLTTGKGCVSTLSACSSYTQTQGCTGLIGSDGPCTANTAAGSTACRALACTDAPASTNTNAGCVAFLAGCVTTGQGCTNSLGSCSSYTGTTTTCASYVGSDGNCKGTSATAAGCAARTCADAPTTTNTNAACSAFQSGCVTTGAGCTSSLGSCTSYQGTNTTCTQYIGNDGNCTAPSSQTSAAACAAKVCTDAPATTTTNAACQAFSYQCVTNGAGCIAPTTCEATALTITCQGNSACASTQICLNRSSCVNYLNQSQCQLNQQQYSSGGTVYLRTCTWATGACSNQLCTALATTLTTDTACSAALAGCLTNGAGCLDVSAPCTAYQGTSTACAAFKGLNGTQSCGNASAATSTTNCIIRSCTNANTAGTISSAANCSSWLSGCNYNGKDNCTVGDCNTYYGTQTTCGAITTAVTGSPAVAQTCWKVANPTDATTACVPKSCDQATGVTYLTNAQCNAFFSGCVWNGLSTGGCVVPSTACTVYKGTLPTCATFSESNKLCTKTTGFCRAIDCTTKTPPSTATTPVQKGTYCQGFTDSTGNTCQMGATACAQPAVTSCTSFVAIGADTATKANYCQSLGYPGADACGYTSGDNCAVAACAQFTPSGATADLKATNCQGLVIDGTSTKCGLATSASAACSNRACTDYGTTSANCATYATDCAWSTGSNVCYTKLATCDLYTIPSPFTTTEFLKASYCGSIVSAASATQVCTYVSATDASKCTPIPTDCTGITFPATITTDLDKTTFCVSQGCAYSGDAASKCAKIATCDMYAPSSGGSPTDLDNQTICQKLHDATPNVCSYTTGTNKCVVPNADCTTYKTYGTSLAANQAFCAQLTGGAAKCASNSAVAGSCKVAACGDITTGQSFATCAAYNSGCTFDGSACVAANAACSAYTAQSTGSGQQANCAAMAQTDNTKCGWTTGNTCTTRVCAQLTGAGANATTCNAYKAGCQYNGAACVDKSAGDCTSYTPQGATDAAKAAICNNMVNSGGARCTYIGANTCVDTIAACAYNKPAAATTDALAQAACSLAQDPNGLQCGFAAGANVCSARACTQALTALLDADCSTYLKGCEQDPTTSCASIDCTKAPITLTTNAACGTYRTGCITNGAGCVEPSAACTAYKGTQTICNAFVGNSVPCTNASTAAATDACINRTCVLNTTAKSDAECKTWLSTCVWGGSSGCVNPQPCASFTGTVDSCPTFTANDGPCYGTGTVAAPAACAANNSQCTGAPATYNTDAQCKTWGTACITNGFGCISNVSVSCSSILSPLACPLYKTSLGCDLANQCKTKPSTCGGFTTASECNNTPLTGSTTLTCAWNAATTTCVPLTCALLPVTLTTDSGCSAVISTCTTNGAGCVTKAACSTYTKQACGPAATTDTQKVCLWSNSVCRPIQCTDNTTATSDAACNTYLAGCRTTGAGCASTLTCSVFTSASFCLFDSTGSPCLWYKSSSTAAGTCINYRQCTDIASSSHAACQAASPLCTTNGTTCIAITGCSKTVLQASCILGTDGNCGWLPAAGATAAACALYTNCSAATGTTTAQCLAWGPTCVSNGTSCMSKSTCSSYTTQTGCGNAGTDGTCFWVAPTGTQTTGTCRLQLCSDATTNLTTHTGCVAFAASTACTTSGTACIPQATCSAYTVQAGCVQGTDGVCFWATTTTAATNTTAATTSSVCRLKQCTDSLLTSSASCSNAITGVKCVSNGVNCIPQSTCSSYTAREACLGGGSDGACAFTPGTNTTTPNVGTCALFTQCTNANSDQTACNTRADACFFNSTTTNGTTTSSCSPHTCATRALGSSCQPVPSWDLSTYQICVLTGTTCAAGNPTSLTQSNCYANSVGTYSWSVNTSACTVCISTTNNNTNNNTNNTNNTYGYLISLLLTLALMF